MLAAFKSVDNIAHHCVLNLLRIEMDWPGSSLVEGKDQMDRPNSQTTMELGHACVG